jgi:hypothetical protein
MAILIKATKELPVAVVFLSAASVGCLVALFWVVPCAVSWLFCFCFGGRSARVRRGSSREKVERRVTDLSPVCELQGCVFLLFSATIAATWVVERLKDTLENAKIPWSRP